MARRFMPAASVDLLRGGVASALGRLALPIVAASLIQMAYGLTDLFWVGKIGAEALAAVGTGGLFTWFADGFMYVARMGGQVLSAQAIGRGDPEDARRHAAASIQIGILLGLVFGLLILCFYKPLIAFFHFTSEATVQGGERYLLITSGLVVFSFLSRIYTGLFTACGDSRSPFRINALGLLINMALDPLLILGLGWAVTGAAVATVLAQAIVCFLFVQSARKHEMLRGLPLRRYFRGLYVRLARVGIPSGLQTMCYASISIYISRLVASYGDLAIAAQRLGSQVESLSWMTCEGLAVAVNALIAQNIGARQFRRVRKAYGAALLYVLLFGGLATLLLTLLPAQIVAVFTHVPQTLDVGTRYLRILGYSQLFMCLELMTTGAFAGHGQTALPAILITVLTALRIPLAIQLSAAALALDGIWWAISLTSIAKGVILAILYLLYHRRKEKQAQTAASETVLN